MDSRFVQGWHEFENHNNFIYLFLKLSFLKRAIPWFLLHSLFVCICMCVCTSWWIWKVKKQLVWYSSLHLPYRSHRFISAHSSGLSAIAELSHWPHSMTFNNYIKLELLTTSQGYIRVQYHRLQISSWCIFIGNPHPFWAPGSNWAIRMFLK